jgi:hypothetical protein
VSLRAGKKRWILVAAAESQWAISFARLSLVHVHSTARPLERGELGNDYQQRGVVCTTAKCNKRFSFSLLFSFLLYKFFFSVARSCLSAIGVLPFFPLRMRNGF